MSDIEKNNPFGAVTFHTVDAEYDGQRLDNFLIRLLKGVPKSRIYRLLRKGEVRVNKGRVKADTRLKAGDIIRVAPIRTAQPQSSEMPGSQMRKRLNDSIVFEDDGIIVIDKPSGIAVHGGSGVSFGVIEGLRADRPESRFLELVHRLDRETSGCLMLAKSRAVLVHLQQQMQKKQIKKTYQALVMGRWPKGKSTINAPLKKNTLSSGERMVRVDAEGKASVTHFKIAETFDQATLLDIRLETGRTHQIRVHCQFSGQAIAGDPKYGDSIFNQNMRGQGLKRLFLHANSLEFMHPISDERISVDAPLSNDLKNILNKLK
ncbi:MAG: 23S rRNA pseudouridine(955/2504/2580) synthase RluC [Porticoccaceae bacterium]|nr:23S rRNA pseudouridine(955/2504/2580) synthase RluC [Porticoccaceae bacterium]